MATKTTTKKPQYRNIHVLQIIKYRLPLAGIVSILHRISGLLMFALLPLILLAFEKSLSTEVDFSEVAGHFSNPIIKLIGLILLWAYLHHFCAGIRHLVMDTHRGLEKEQAKRSALSVLAISVSLTIICGLIMFNII